MPHSPASQSEQPKYPDRPRLRAGGDRLDGKENNTKKRLSCATIGWPDCPDHSLALSGGCRLDKYARPTPNPAQKLIKRVLCHTRTTRVPRPAPALSGGVDRMKQEGTPPKPRPQNSENVQSKPIRKPRPPKPRKTKNYRAQRR